MPFTILHTSDIHSHFSGKDNAFGLGGVARLGTLLYEQRRAKMNTVVIDSGDFSEGSIQYTFNHGYSTLKIMDLLNYDAIVLGNHDWLMGPRELYTSLDRSGVTLPLVSANLTKTEFEKDRDIKKFLQPYVIKDFPGLKIGILGLSTFQFIFDGFFAPVKIQDPDTVTQSWVDTLKQKEKCDVVLVVSHLGFLADQRLAKKIKGIDAIVGGHSHILLRRPFSENGVPIFHVGKWGHYVGQYDFEFENKKTQLKNFSLLPVQGQVVSDPMIDYLVAENADGLDRQWQMKLREKILTSEKDLALKDFKSDSIVGHWVADAIRDFAKTDLAFENPSYVSRDIFQGETTLGDFFNIFPHIFNPQTQKAWTIKTFKITGSYLKVLMSAVFRAGIYLRLSNASAVLDHYKSINQVREFKIGGKDVSPRQIYSVAGTNGVLEAIELLKSYGVEVGVRDVYDTGVEAWKVVAHYFKNLSPITSEKLIWEGRVRTFQPDLVIFPEEIQVKAYDEKNISLSVVVRNTGMQPAMGSTLTVRRAPAPNDTIVHEERYIDIPIQGKTEIELEPLSPGEARKMEFLIPTEGITPGRYAAVFYLSAAMSELETENNVLDTYFDIPERP